MSSWLSQSCDVTLSQKSYPVMEDLCMESQAGTHAISSKHKEGNDLYRTCTKIFTKYSTPNLSSKQSQNTASHKSKETVIELCSKKNAILLFGFSRKSHSLPHHQSQVRSPLWNLMSQTVKREATQLFKDLYSQDTPKTNSDSHKTENHSKNAFASPETTKETASKIQNYPQALPKETSQTSVVTKQVLLKEEKLPTSVKAEILDQQKQVSNDSISFSLKDDIEKDGHSDQNQQDSSSQEDEKELIQGKPKHVKHISMQSAFFKRQKKTKTIPPEQVVPVIPLPSVGIFTLSYLLTKQGILCDYYAYKAYKDNVETTQNELEIKHKERSKILREQLEKEHSAKRWGTLASLIEWLSPWIAIGVSILAITIGNNVFASLTLISGFITLTLALMDSFNIWDRLEKFLPGTDLKKKQKILKITYFSILIANALLSIITIRINNLKTSVIINKVMLGIGPAFESASTVIRAGALWTHSVVLDTQAALARLENLIDQLTQERDDTYQSVEDLVENIQAQFETISQILSLEQEVNASQIDLMRS